MPAFRPVLPEVRTPPFFTLVEDIVLPRRLELSLPASAPRFAPRVALDVVLRAEPLGRAFDVLRFFLEPVLFESELAARPLSFVEVVLRMIETSFVWHKGQRFPAR